MSTPITRSASTAGTQTLLRGLTVLELVADGAADVKTIAARLGTARSTMNRLDLHAVAIEGAAFADVMQRDNAFFKATMAKLPVSNK